MNLFEKFKKDCDKWEPFDRYKVTIKIGTIAGGKPANPKMIEPWVNAGNKELEAAEKEARINATAETLPEIVEEAASAQTTVFSRVDGKLAIEGRQIKAMLKESGNIIREFAPGGTKGVKGITALKSKVADRVFVEEEWIGLGRETPDAVEERAIHVMTAQGPRNSLKRVELVRDVEISFTVRRAAVGVPEVTLMAILDYAQTVGLGADRSQGRGLFEVLSVEKL